MPDTKTSILPRGSHRQKMTGSISDFEDLPRAVIASNALVLPAFIITPAFQQSPQRPCPRRAGCGHAKAPCPSNPRPRAAPAAAGRPGAGRAAASRASTSNGSSGGGTPGPRGKRAREGRGPWERLAGAGRARGPPGSCPGTAGEDEARRPQVRRRQGDLPGPGLQGAGGTCGGRGLCPGEGRWRGGGCGPPRCSATHIKGAGKEAAAARHQRPGC